MKLAVFTPFTKLPSLLPQPLSFQRELSCEKGRAGRARSYAVLGGGVTGVQGPPGLHFLSNMLSGEPAVTVIKVCCELSPSKVLYSPRLISIIIFKPLKAERSRDRAVAFHTLEGC